jgi:non-specific serine/threonine protein kinase/serine/threonine-protein kinase
VRRPDENQSTDDPASDERRNDVEELARNTLERAAADRAAFLEAACPDDPGLRDKARELVQAYERTGPSRRTVLSRPPFAPPPAVKVGPGDALGPFLLLDRIGEGAMAAVYRASHQDAGAVVAVKVAQRGLVAGHQRLFQVEAQILRLLDHPNVLRFVDDGTLDDGRPYIVAEYVDGLPIDQFCDRWELGLDRRLDLFRQACAAVEHVHRHGVVHRDVKPRNLLVTRGGVAKLVDFGIALPLAGGSAASGPPTERPMTPQYASPEQVRGGEITARSDVYSLGVVLYKLLTGRLPHGDAEAVLGPREMARLFDGGRPRRPSEAAASEDMRRRLAGGLDEVVLRALAERPEERQVSAEALAAEIRAAADRRTL